MATLTYLEAIRLALAEEMRRDERVFLMGEDIGAYGGAFKVTAGLLEEFGPERVIDTPIAEAGIIGAAIGAALMGRLPVVEMQFIDFISNGFQLLTNFAAKCHYRWGAAVHSIFRERHCALCPRRTRPSDDSFVAPVPLAAFAEALRPSCPGLLSRRRAASSTAR